MNQQHLPYCIKTAQILVLIICLAASINRIQAQTKRYVKPTAVGLRNGLSWNDATNDLQAAINASAAGDTVWVAAGTYHPTNDYLGNANPPNPSDKTFYLKKGVSVMGGFFGNENYATQRNLGVDSTVLSGVLSGNNRCFHVVLSVKDSSNALFDGFTITGGRALFNGYITIDSVDVSRGDGAGLCAIQSNITVRNCIFRSNIIDSTPGAAGGGMEYLGDGVVEHCSFMNNNSTGGYAAMVDSYGSGASFSGKGILRNCLFSGNFFDGGNGGALFLRGRIENCIFVNNTVTSRIAYLNRNPFTMGGEGGAIFVSDTSTIVNSVFIDNTSSRYGNDIYIDPRSQLTITNCTLYHNASTSVTSMIYNNYTSNLIVNNSILWGNANITPITNNSHCIVSNSICRPLQGSIIQQHVNNVDPAFSHLTTLAGSDNIYGTADDGLTLTACSDGVNAGLTPNNTLFDITGAARIQQGTCDIGAYESNFTALTIQPDFPILGCIHHTATLTASGMGSYIWSSGGSLVSPTVTTTYSVSATGSTGCTSTRSITIVVDTTTPVVNVLGTNPTTTSSNDGRLVAIVHAGLTPFHYLWSTGDTLSVLHGLPSGSYTLTVTSASGCTQTVSFLLSSASCHTIAQIDRSQVFQNTISVSANNTGLGSSLRYIWDFGDNNTSNAIAPVHHYQQPGVYTVCLTVFDSLSLCSDSYCDTVTARGPYLGVDSSVSSISSFAFPNPATTYINFPVSGQLRLFDLSGRLLDQTPVTVSEPYTVATLPAGLYIFEIQTKDSLHIGRFVINRH